MAEPEEGVALMTVLDTSLYTTRYICRQGSAVWRVGPRSRNHVHEEPP